MTMTLQLVRGLPRIVDDTNSNESVETIDLLNPDELTIDPDGGWVPGVGQAVARFADQGDVLLAAPVDRVTETMRLLVKASSPAARATLIEKLNQFARDAERLHIDQTWTSPVYLKWQPPGAAKLQYALVYSVNISATADLVGMEEVDEWSLEIVREAGWRAIAPGANPKQYTAEAQSLAYNLSRARLDRSTTTPVISLASGVAYSAQQATSGNADSTTRNYLSLPAASIPGDLPAPLLLTLSDWWTGASTIVQGNTIIIGKWSRPTRQLNVAGGTVRPCFNRSLSHNTTIIASTDTATATDAGASGASSGTQQRINVTFATVTALTDRLFIPINTGVHPHYLFPGTYRVFLRARLSAAGTVGLRGSFGTLYGRSILGQTIPFTDTGAGGTGTTTEWGVVDLGVFSVPQYGVGFIDPDSGGAGFEEDLRFYIAASRTSGTPTLYMSDVTFIPLDEGATIISSSTQNLSVLPDPPGSVITTFLYDNANLYGRGLQQEGGVALVQNTVADVLTVAGAPLTATPGRENLFPIFVYNATTRRSVVGDGTIGRYGLNMTIDAVPRWLGRRT